MALVIKNGRVIDPASGTDRVADVLIVEGRIAGVAPDLTSPHAEIFDAAGMVVAPGFIDTDMTRALSDEQRAALAVQIPLARLGSVDDIAAAVVFLASPAGGYITGETLSVNGGMYMP